MNLINECTAWITHLAKTFLRVSTLEESIHEEKDFVTSSTTYIGETLNINNPNKAEAIWRISRQTITVAGTVLEYAGTGIFDQVWNNRTDLFSPVYQNNLSLRLNGNQRILFPDHAGLDFDENTPFTICISTNNLNGVGVLLDKRNGTGGEGVFFQQDGSGRPEIDLRGTGGTSDRIRLRLDDPLDNTNTGQWKTIIISYDGGGDISGLKMTVNNSVEAGSRNERNNGLVTTINNAVAMAVGANVANGQDFTGLIDELVIWIGTELSDTQKTTYYNNGNLSDPRGIAGLADPTFFVPFESPVDAPVIIEEISGNDGDGTSGGEDINDFDFLTEVAG